MVLLAQQEDYFTDYRDRHIYKTVKIGDQIWMAENLNYNTNDSEYYKDNIANDDKYGKLYDWATAMDLPSSCNFNSCVSQISVKHRGICPDGWHLPNNREWTELTDLVDKNNYKYKGHGIKSIMAKNGWIDHKVYDGTKRDYGIEVYGNGTDDYGFAALPGGYAHDCNAGRINVGIYGYWWTATECIVPIKNCPSIAMAVHKTISYKLDFATNNVEWKTRLYSIRCIKD
jgi:uncharacterized protein (TIGR02145 family)